MRFSAAFIVARQPPVGHGLLFLEVSRSHSDTSHSVGLLWASDQPVAETTHNTHKIQTSMHRAKFEPATPASERPQTHTLDRAATWRGFTEDKKIN